MALPTGEHDDEDDFGQSTFLRGTTAYFLVGDNNRSGIWPLLDPHVWSDTPRYVAFGGQPGLLPFGDCIKEKVWGGTTFRAIRALLRKGAHAIIFLN